MRTGRGLMALLVALLAVGTIRSAIPEGVPGEFEVRPDDDGFASIQGVTVEVIGMETASSVRPAGDFSDARYVASPGTVLVLGRFALTAHGGPFFVQTQVRTADGYSYAALRTSGLVLVSVAEVGVTVTATYVYEVPKDKVSGDIALHAFRPDGVQPVFPVVMTGLPDELDLEPGEVVVPAVETVVAP